jgi:hypothetical protein
MVDQQAPPASDEWCNALALITPYEFSWHVITWDWHNTILPKFDPNQRYLMFLRRMLLN